MDYIFYCFMEWNSFKELHFCFLSHEFWHYWQTAANHTNIELGGALCFPGSVNPLLRGQILSRTGFMNVGLWEERVKERTPVIVVHSSPTL